MDEEEREVAWLAMPEKAPVMDEAGDEIGRTEELLGDREDDIFHGIVVRLARGGHRGGGGADRDPKDTTHHVYTGLGADELEHPPEHREGPTGARPFMRPLGAGSVGSAPELLITT